MRLMTALLLLTLTTAANASTRVPELHAEGVRLYLKSDDRGALASLDAALAADPRFLPSREVRAMVHMSRQDWAAAIADLDVIVAASPSPMHLMLRGSCRGASGDLLAGIADAEAALALDPAYAPALDLRANLRKAAGR